jgi:hypothetical protein
LSGIDTIVFGNTLTVGDVARVSGPGSILTYYFVELDAEVAGFDYLSTETDQLFQNTTMPDPENAFVLNVADTPKIVSMTIRVGGVDYDYAGGGLDGLTFDPANNTIVFDDVVVPAPTILGPTFGPLTLNGTLTWQVN